MAWLAVVLCWLAPLADPAPVRRDAVVLAGIERLGGKGGATTGAEAIAAAEPAEYPVEAAARSTRVFLLPDGPRTVRSLEVVATPSTAAAWRAARLRLVWDDDDPDPAGAAVDVPLGRAFGRTGDRLGDESLAVGTEGDAWVLRLPMPYRGRAILRIDADAPLAGLIRVRASRGIATDAGYLHAAEWTGPGRLAGDGRGHLAGFRLFGDEEKARRRAGEVVTLTLDDGPARPLGAGIAVNPTIWTWYVADPPRFTHSFAWGADADVPSGTTALIYWYTDRPGLKRDGGP